MHAANATMVREKSAKEIKGKGSEEARPWRAYVPTTVPVAAGRSKTRKEGYSSKLSLCNPAGPGGIKRQQGGAS